MRISISPRALVRAISRAGVRPHGPGALVQWSAVTAMGMGIAMTMAADIGVGLPTAHGASPDADLARRVRPLLADRCFRCHGPDPLARKAGLRLDRREEATRTLKSGRAALVPGDPGSSELVRRITSRDPDEVMPPQGSQRTLSDAERQELIDWVADGARYAQHWALEPLTRPEAPQVSRRDWPQGALDRFILARLEDEGLAPSPLEEAPRLVRRLHLDLLGLPPLPAEAEAFERDEAPDAWDRLVDRVLASPAFGERMAWDWLDAARYADSNGYQGDGERTMWPWRDWVVAAVNRNLGYDLFTIWQVAGDLLPQATDEERLATGFLRNHAINGEGGRIAEENRVDYVMDMAETVGTVWLGLTFNCCRCHDHKFDPLTRRDYYSMFAFFNQTPIDGGGGNPRTPPVLAAPSDEQARERTRLEEVMASAATLVEEREAELRGRAKADGPAAAGGGAPAAAPFTLDGEVLKLLERPPRERNKEQLAKLEERLRGGAPRYADAVRGLREAKERREELEGAIPLVMVMEDRAEPRKTFILEKGLYTAPGEEVTARTPESLPPLMEAPRNRLALARWLVGPENPLVARVTVNRLWRQLLGAGLVRTVEDFGTQGEPPSHPGLLDALAWELRESGWDWKRLCRAVVTSATYRQSSRISPELLERDPSNRLLGRSPRFRLPSWALRDQALAVSGLLVGRLGGLPVFPYQPPGVWEDATFGNKSYRQDHGEGLYRRSLYTFWRRIVGPTMIFDNATRQTCSVKQSRTNTPLHALTTLNDTTYVEAARSLAASVLGAAPEAPARALVGEALRRVLIRRATEEELAILERSLQRQEQRFAADSEGARRLLGVGESACANLDDPAGRARLAALAAVCGALLNLDEALTRE